mgnify:CR=1 FL=1
MAFFAIFCYFFAIFCHFLPFFCHFWSKFKISNLKKIHASITAVGSYLPEKILTNADLEKLVDTSDDWILTRTGIKERRILEEGIGVSFMAINAVF